MRFLILPVFLFALLPDAVAQSGENTPFAPEWLTLKGSVRARYESLEGQYRLGRSVSDQLISFRTNILATASVDVLELNLEIMDSRAYGSDEDGSVSTGEVNALEPIQAFARIDLKPLTGLDNTKLALGVMTLDLGSRRLVGRNGFRNTTNTFAGASLVRTSEQGDRLTGFLTRPVARLPEDRTSLLDNEVRLDGAVPDTLFWGVFGETAHGPAGLSADLYVLGLSEYDDANSRTRNRDIVTTGGRLWKPEPKTGFDFELEAALQTGSARATARDDDLRDLDVEAFFVHADLGYRFDAPWQPHLEIFYDYASGEADPTDGKWTRFDPLFGPRRGDFGPTGLYGALSRVNISAPGIGISVKPDARWDGFADLRQVWLAEPGDRLDRAGLQDASGAAGRDVGQQFQLRARYWLVPKTVRAEFGGAVLFKGDVFEQAVQPVSQDDTRYVYADITWSF